MMILNWHSCTSTVPNLPANLKVLPEKQHGDGDVVLRRGRPGAFEGESYQPAAAKHGGSSHSALHACLRALLRHRAHWVHWWPLQVAVTLNWTFQPQALRRVNKPGDLLGCHWGAKGTQPAEAHEDHQAFHQDRPALPRVQELQLNVCHHQVRKEGWKRAHFPHTSAFKIQS